MGNSNKWCSVALHQHPLNIFHVVPGCSVPPASSYQCCHLAPNIKANEHMYQMSNNRAPNNISGLREVVLISITMWYLT